MTMSRREIDTRYNATRDDRARSKATGVFSGLMMLLAMLATLPLSAQQGSTSAPAVNGTEYYVSFPPSDPDLTNQFMGLMITSEFTTNGTIEIPDVASIQNPWDTIRGFTTRPFSVRAGEVTMIEIPRLLEPYYPSGSNAELNHNGEISLRAVRVTSRAPIAVTAVNARQGSSGAYAALPVERWGTEYAPIALPATPNDRELTSQLIITAAHDGTVVEVYPSARSGRWSTGERIPDFTMERGEIWLLQADAEPGTEGSMDLSGTTIIASKPISVVAGHTRAALSKNPTQVFPRTDYAAWHAAPQMPTDGKDLGGEYYTTPFRSTGDRFRLIAHQSNTTVTLKLFDANGNAAAERTLSMRWKGEVLDVAVPEGLSLDRPAQWYSQKPFALYQIRTTAGDYSSPENRPAMIRVVPTTRFAARTNLTVPEEFRGEKFGDFTADLVVRGTDDPRNSVTLDGVLLADVPNVQVTRINGNVWHVALEVSPGGHVLQGSNDAVISGRIGGTNTAIGGVSLDWTLPHWNPSIDYDREAPYLTSTKNPTISSVEVLVSDRTDNYFSGVGEIAAVESPGWERKNIALSPDPDVDGSARFAVRNGYDPSGPLNALLRDRDGNERRVTLHAGVCLQTAYTATDSVLLVVRGDGSVTGSVQIDANPCGESATIAFMTYDANGEANDRLLDPVITAGNAAIDPNGTATITIETKRGLEGQYVLRTSLEVRIDNAVISVPVILDVDHTSSVRAEEEADRLDLTITPNPIVRAGMISVNPTLLRASGRERVEIIDPRGVTLRTFSLKELDADGRVMWDGRDEEGNRVSAGLYLLKAADGLRKVIVR